MRSGSCLVRGMRGERILEGLTERVIGCAIAVHRELGPGLLESVYQTCLRIELEEHRLAVETQRRVSLRYRNRPVPIDLAADLIVEGQLLLELKSVEQLHAVHVAQVITYLKLSGCPVGLLINFNTTTLRSGLRRLEHPDIYTPRQWRANPGSANTSSRTVAPLPTPSTASPAERTPEKREPRFE